MQTKPLFSDARAKLARAKQFIQELEANIDAYRKSDPIKARFDMSVNPPNIIIEYAAVPQPAETILGDCIHNMRTALDQMASELARLRGGRDKGVYFPFSTSGNRLDAAIKEKNFYRAGQDAVDLLKAFAPYRGGNELLRALHDLDVHDKHKALITIGRTMSIQVVGTYQLDNPQLHNASVAKHDIHYVFSDDGIFAGQRIIETLKDLMKLVDGIIEALRGWSRRDPNSDLPKFACILRS